ncbi:MAG: DUF2784 domain-containing protein [Gemmatimonadales bacterium]
MFYRFAADVVVLIHLAFVLFVVFGALMALRWPRVILLHLPAAIWGALIEFQGLICPLTPLENRLRILGGQAGYTGGFVEHYLMPLLYPSGLTRTVQLTLGAVVVTVNGLLYALVWFKRRRARSR